MRKSRALLHRLRHDPRYDFSRASVDYVDRGAPGDISTAAGGMIASLEAGGMEIHSGFENKFIPFHRILRISYDGSTLWQRPVAPGIEPRPDSQTDSQTESQPDSQPEADSREDGGDNVREDS